MSRVNLYEEEFEKLIDDRGNLVDWERAAVCWCVDKISGQPQLLCPTCGGSGYRYMKPKRITVAVTNLSGHMELKTLETRVPGTAYITPERGVIMGYRDRLRFPEFKCMFSEVLHWDEDGLPYGVSPKTHREIKEVLLLADEDYQYEQGIDFEITEDRFHLRWFSTDFAPRLYTKNSSMSILYYTSPSYLVVDLLHELRATRSDRNSGGVITFRELPKQYQIQREDFVYNIGVPEALTEKDIEEDIQLPNSSYPSLEGIRV